MQIDSHHRVVQDWDTKVIEMLHSCDAGEYSVLSVYPPCFGQEDPKDGWGMAIIDDILFSMRWYDFTATNMPIVGGRGMDYNVDKMVRPWETPVITGNF